MNNKRVFDGAIRSITSTRNGEICVVQNFPFSRVFVLKNEDVISIYTGHPSVNKFDPMSVVTTPLDNVIVADQCNYKLHILDNNGHLLTIYNTKVIGSEYPSSLAISMEGLSAVLYIGYHSHEIISKTGKLHTK